MDKFMHKYGSDVTGILSGFDRLVFRGTARRLAWVDGLASYLRFQKVLLKDWDQYALKMTAQLKRASYAEAKRLGRPIPFIPSSRTSKEKEAQAIAKRDGVKEGLIAVLRAMEVGRSYEIVRDRALRKLRLAPSWRKSLFLYHYWIDPEFGFMNARIQTWFPFSIQVCLNGREWLARQMDRAGIRYERWENCFPWIEDVAEAQRLMDEQLRVAWPKTLQAIARRLNPAHEAMFAPATVQYYWTVYQDEWATDLMFRSREALAGIYRKLVRAGITVFQSEDVMGFLGRKPHGRFQGDVVTTYRQRPEGVRIKHTIRRNSLKLYDKFGQVLRAENTLNNPSDFKVYRPKEGDPEGPKSWRPMRRGIADLHRRTKLQHAANKRYLDAQASLATDRHVGELVTPVCRPTRWKRQRVRALRPWSEPDQPLLQIISRGEFLVGGFRNRDLVAHLHPDGFSCAADRQKAAARVTRLLRLLRAHRIIRKIPHTHRYLLTTKGREITTAIIQTYNTNTAQLTEIAA